MEEQKIKQQAREILDKFSKALEGIELKKKDLKEEIGGFRKEDNGEVCDEDFRKRMFENAPESQGDFLISEKKKW